MAFGDDFELEDTIDLDDDIDLGENISEQEFSTDFDSMSDDEGTEEMRDTGKKRIIIGMIVSIGIILAGILIYNTTIGNKDNNSTVNTVNKKEETVKDTYNDNKYINKDENVVVNNRTEKSEWADITANEEIVFNSEYSEATFTVTSIKHKAKVSGSEVQVKTELRGSISGLTGTYVIDVPYNKGVSILVGNMFKVDILLGTYGEKTVLGDIQY